MDIYQLSALAAALCWALNGLVSSGPSGEMGAMAFVRYRQWVTLVMLLVFIGATALLGREGFSTVDSNWWLTIIASGLIGIFLGDSFLFITLNRLGPRRTAMLFSCNAPMTAVLGWLVLGETLAAGEWFGIALVTAGVMLAILYGKRKEQRHHWESIKGALWIGVACGLIAALGQAVGSLIIRPVMQSGADPVTISAMRVGVAGICLSLLGFLPMQALKAKVTMTKQLFAVVCLSAFLAMALGMTLLLYGFSGGETGIIATLSATTPALMLPLIWMKTKERPAAGAFAGAALVVIGSGLIFQG
ncbi:DMT family transporter [Ahrensia sp. R2A130]|uniref:DMT family transporter n=1 Tax=Ahrensia sp. R2A130 TaxID=744979 RepID=UPI0001E09C0B|nr:DMT family transporter [Ahrensia sp. R2A130]EFL90602.1 permease [Ahrensia sp. R2A130]